MKTDTKVLKFGSSSLASPEALEQIGRVIAPLSNRESLTLIVSSGNEKPRIKISQAAESAAGGSPSFSDILQEAAGHYIELIQQTISEKNRGGSRGAASRLLARH